MITINTSEYTTYKKATIDGVELGFRRANSAETLRIAELQDRIASKPENQIGSLKEIIGIIYGLSDNPKKAEELLSGLAFDAILDIYKLIMES